MVVVKEDNEDINEWRLGRVQESLSCGSFIDPSTSLFSYRQTTASLCHPIKCNINVLLRFLQPHVVDPPSDAVCAEGFMHYGIVGD